MGLTRVKVLGSKGVGDGERQGFAHARVCRRSWSKWTLRLSSSGSGEFFVSADEDGRELYEGRRVNYTVSCAFCALLGGLVFVLLAFCTGYLSLP